MRITITSTGLYVPPKIETAEQLAPRVGKTSEWVAEVAGVVQRHIAEEPMESMAAKAAARALGDGPPPDLLLNASATPRQLIPDTSVFIARELGLEGVPCHSIHATCLSFIVAVHNAAALIHAGAYERVLVVSSEIGTSSRNYDEPESAAVLGDGAAAVVIERTPEGGTGELLQYRMNSFPDGSDLAEFRGAGIRFHPNNTDWSAADYTFHMDGPAIFRKARRRVGQLLDQVLQPAGMTLGDVDKVVPHQPSGPAVRALQLYGFKPEQVVDIVADYGNCIAASVPMALAWAHEREMLNRGDRIMLIGTGAGLSVAAALLRW